MIIPGLDRLDGTHVNGEVLHTDELWEAHTAEIMAALAKENERRRGTGSDEPLSVMEFCWDYANGSKTTEAMRIGMRELNEMKMKRKNLADETPNTMTTTTTKWNPDPEAKRLKAATGKAFPRPTHPGLIACMGVGYAFLPENSVYREQLAAVLDKLKHIEGLYISPEFSLHVTVAVLWKFSVSDAGESEEEQAKKKKKAMRPETPEAWSKAIKSSPELRNLLVPNATGGGGGGGGPIHLLAREVKLVNGNAIIVLFSDESHRFPALRGVFRTLAASPPLAALECEPNMAVPDIVHSTVARVCDPILDEKNQREIEAALAQWKPCPVVLRDLSLVVERTAYYLHGVPEDIIARIPTEAQPFIAQRTYFEGTEEEKGGDAKRGGERDEAEEEKTKQRKGNTSGGDLGSVLLKLFLGSLVISCLTMAVVMHHSAVVNYSKKRSI